MALSSPARRRRSPLFAGGLALLGFAANLLVARAALFLAKPLTPRLLVAAAIIFLGVALALTRR